MRGLGLILAAGVLAAPVAADDTTVGAELFLGYCAACHGVGAMGDGPMTDILEIAPPDLTGLAAANDGVFPMADVVRTIDGRTTLVSHGGPMPVFGMILRGEAGVIDAEDGSPIITKQAVVDIAAWLASVQR
jgi:mono/diheme cytochrome c family protein